jgi:protocatechuate 3,4-dioxygenase beta subunit
MIKLLSVSLLSVVAFCFMSSIAPARVSAAATIQGTVTGTNGQPAASIEVKLMKAEKHARHAKPAAANGAAAGAAHAHHAAAALQTTTTKPDGSFSFANVAPGDYVVTAGAKGEGHGRAKVTVTGDQTETVSIKLAVRQGGHQKPASTK